jgi:DNA polymerase III epsilon subunit-like protein
MFLFFDTETTGIPRNYKAPVSDLANWPRVIQLAFLLTDPTGAAVSSKQFLIKPDGFSIPKDATKIHGITTERATAEGIEIRVVLDEFLAIHKSAVTLIAHNMAYDEKVLGAEFLRAELPNPLPKSKRICTMQSATNFCQIPGPYGYKWPRLDELHFKLFQRKLDDAHSAEKDVQACAACFFEMKARGLIPI